MQQHIDSTSDARAENSPVKHAYRILSDQEKVTMSEIKDLGVSFIEKLHAIGGTDPNRHRQASRDLSLAQTHAEDAVMRAVRHITA